jgi:hypothetical protein
LHWTAKISGQGTLPEVEAPFADFLFKSKSKRSLTIIWSLNVSVDPTDRRYVHVKPSLKFPDAGESLFASADIDEGNKKVWQSLVKELLRRRR